MHMAMLLSSTLTPTVAIGPPSAGIQAQVVDGDCKSARGSARHESQNAQPTAATIALMLTVAAAVARRRSGGMSASRRKLKNGSPSTASAIIAEPTFTLMLAGGSSAQQV